MKEPARIILRIDPEVFSKIREKAKEKKVTFNKYVEKLCLADLAASGEAPETDDKRPPARLTISLSEEEREIVRKKTAETGLPPWEIIRKLLCQSCPAIINIEVYDILKLEETIEPFIATIYGIARVIFQSQKAFPADLQKILSCTEKIGQAFAEVVRLETAGRSQPYEEARKEYFPEVESTKHDRSIRNSLNYSHDQAKTDPAKAPAPIPV
ncbi:MAG: hypothetical protein K5696_01200 [Lachnospiraceae bacterium]|nr:hypothetical protein [Lachnospiraceae bacterium]